MTLTRQVAVTLVAAALIAPSAALQRADSAAAAVPLSSHTDPVERQDLRSPDARDAAGQAQAAGVQDLRSPDARDAARRAETPSAQDLPSPEARDASTATIVVSLLATVLVLGVIAGTSRSRRARRRVAA